MQSSDDTNGLNYTIVYSSSKMTNVNIVMGQSETSLYHISQTQAYNRRQLGRTHKQRAVVCFEEDGTQMTRMVIIISHSSTLTIAHYQAFRVLRIAIPKNSIIGNEMLSFNLCPLLIVGPRNQPSHLYILITGSKQRW